MIQQQISVSTSSVQHSSALASEVPMQYPSLQQQQHSFPLTSGKAESASTPFDYFTVSHHQQQQAQQQQQQRSYFDLPIMQPVLQMPSLSPDTRTTISSSPTDSVALTTPYVNVTPATELPTPNYASPLTAHIYTTTTNAPTTPYQPRPLSSSSMYDDYYYYKTCSSSISYSQQFSVHDNDNNMPRFPELWSSHPIATTPGYTEQAAPSAAIEASYQQNITSSAAISSPYTSSSSSSYPAETDALRYNIVLQAPSAVTPKVEDVPVTYLNRGQAYCIQLSDTTGSDKLITSTLSLTFHDPSHRRVAGNYWKFWLGQQQNPAEARALDLDLSRSSGIMNIRSAGFDQVTFEWHGRQGARIHVRFHCLSTDFSRIKGVKGIPLRAHMESKVVIDNVEYTENSFCKIKLFRDKGAERKNKDDAKQFKKHVEKMQASGKRSAAMELYRQPSSYTTFIRAQMDKWQTTSHDRSMTAPAFVYGAAATAAAAAMPSVPVPQPAQLSQNALLLSAAPSRKRARTCNNSSPELPVTATTTKRRLLNNGNSTATTTTATTTATSTTNNEEDLLLYVSLSSSQQQQRAGVAGPMRLIRLEQRNLQCLKEKLCAALGLEPGRVSEIVRRQTPQEEAPILTLVEDEMISQDFASHSVIWADWSIKANGAVRIVIQLSYPQ